MVVADRHADKARRGEGNRLRDQKAKPQAHHQRKHADDQRFRQDYRGNLSRAHAEQKVGAELLLAGSNHEPVGVEDQKAQNDGDDYAEIGHDLGQDIENARTRCQENTLGTFLGFEKHARIPDSVEGVEHRHAQGQGNEVHSVVAHAAAHVAQGEFHQHDDRRLVAERGDVRCHETDRGG